MLSMPAIVENCFSSGVATADAIVSGLAPGRLAFTVIVGKSTVGRSLTGSRRYAMMPKNRIPAITSTVVTGRRMNSSERFIVADPPALPTTPACVRRRRRFHVDARVRRQPRLSVDHDLLAHHQSASRSSSCRRPRVRP